MFITIQSLTIWSFALPPPPPLNYCVICISLSSIFSNFPMKYSMNQKRFRYVLLEWGVFAHFQ